MDIVLNRSFACHFGHFGRVCEALIHVDGTTWSIVYVEICVSSDNVLRCSLRLSIQCPEAMLGKGEQ